MPDKTLNESSSCTCQPPTAAPSSTSRSNVKKENTSSSVSSCLHCSLPPPCTPHSTGIQVSCDDCHAFICSSCHWCHEFQANHEIRVCDRCDAFYCRACDEMDQCEDCSEVVCSSCTTLLSCKFCGCGLCEDCATACGRCGIVLCGRDAKFAVECDTCKMSYCLVCLASGTKESCVRCGHRMSKRVEQLVHLRLKSIYKAFRQSGAAAASSHSKDENGSASSSNHGSHRRNTSNGTGSHKNGNATRASAAVAAAAALARAAGVPSDATSSSDNDLSLAGDVSAVLQAAAAATHPSSDHPRRRSSFKKRMESSGSNSVGGSSSAAPSTPPPPPKECFYSRTQAEADAAAAELLAELEEEERRDASDWVVKGSKKSKKKKKKAAREAAKALESNDKNANTSPSQPYSLKNIKQNEKSTASGDEKMSKEGSSKKSAGSSHSSTNVQKDENENTIVNESDDEIDGEPSTSVPDGALDDEEFIAHHQRSSSALGALSDDNDNVESQLTDLVSAGDEDGIEKLLSDIRGVPGRAALRKNAKKALKKIREEKQAALDRSSAASSSDTESQTVVSSKTIEAQPPAVPAATAATTATTGYKPPEPLLKLVSHTHQNRSRSTPSNMARSECVMHMAPSVVGWVIGKGGQRIRELMEESGAKVWIDQDSMGPKEARIVYVSGQKKSVDCAVRMVKDLVAKAPVGTATTIQQPPVQPKTTTQVPLPITEVQVSSPVPFKAARPTAIQPPRPQSVTTVATAATAPTPISVPTPIVANQDIEPVSTFQKSGVAPPSILTSETTLEGENTITEVLKCEPRFVALLIGRRGWTIKHIQDASGARVHIDQSVTPRKITVSGDPASVRSAVRMVRDVLSYPHAQLHYGEVGGVPPSMLDGEGILKAAAASSGNAAALLAETTGSFGEHEVDGSSSLASSPLQGGVPQSSLLLSLHDLSLDEGGTVPDYQRSASPSSTGSFAAMQANSPMPMGSSLSSSRPTTSIGEVNRFLPLVGAQQHQTHEPSHVLFQRLSQRSALNNVIGAPSSNVIPAYSNIPMETGQAQQPFLNTFPAQSNMNAPGRLLDLEIAPQSQLHSSTSLPSEHSTTSGIPIEGDVLLGTGWGASSTSGGSSLLHSSSFNLDPVLPLERPPVTLGSRSSSLPGPPPGMGTHNPQHQHSSDNVMVDAMFSQDAGSWGSSIPGWGGGESVATGSSFLWNATARQSEDENKAPPAFGGVLPQAR